MNWLPCAHCQKQIFYAYKLDVWMHHSKSPYRFCDSGLGWYRPASQEFYAEPELLQRRLV